MFARQEAWDKSRVNEDDEEKYLILSLNNLSKRIGTLTILYFLLINGIIPNKIFILLYKKGRIVRYIYIYLHIILDEKSRKSIYLFHKD